MQSCRTTTQKAQFTQKPTVFGAKRSIFVPSWVVRCLADWALHPSRKSVSTKVAAASVAPHHDRFEVTEPGHRPSERRLHCVEVWPVAQTSTTCR